MSNKLIAEFNTPDTLVVLSSYPMEGSEAAKQNAVACYTRNLLKAYKGRKIVVLAETPSVNSLERQDNLLIYRCWKPAHPLLLLQLIKAALKFNKAKKYLYQFEFNMLGSTIITSLLPFFMLFLRIFGKSNVVVLHQVIGDLSLLGEHVDIKAKSFKNWFFSNGIRWFYRLTGLFVNHIIVHEQFLKKELTQWVNPEKITVISHGMDLEKPIMRYRKNARIKFGYTKNDFVVLLFGYINWYKGTDWIIKRIGNLYQRNPKLNIKLLVAGGPSVTLESKSHYRRFLAKVEDLAATYNKSVTMAGFVAENDVKKYFAAADLVVLPYRVMISASGPLSFALRFNRPLLLSEKLNHAFDNADAATVLKSINAKPEDFTFNMQGQGFNKRLTLLAKDKKKLANLNKYPKHLRYLRRWENIVIQYSRVIDNNLNTVPVFKLTRGLIELAPAPLMLMTSVQKRG